MDSHLASVIYTNEPPSNTQKRQIKGLIAALKDDVGELDEEIARAQAKREIRLRRIHTYAAALSPCRRLPPELVSKVLLHVHEDIRPIRCLRLAQICSAWRQVALRTTGLWTDIDVDFERKNFSKKMLLLKALCDRAAGYPLSVRIAGPSPPPKIGDLIDILNPYLKSIKSLELDIPKIPFPAIISLPADSFPLLEKFHFVSTCNPRTQSGADHHMQGPFAFALAPRLRDFAYHGQFKPRIMCLPKQLTRVHFNGLTCAQALSSIHYCPHILEFRGTFSKIGASFPEGRIVFPRLQTLDISFGAEANVDNIIDHLTIPALNNLSISSCEHEEVYITSSFASFISRSSCALTELYIGTAEMLGIEFLDVMRLLPSLVVLDLDAIRFMDDTVYTALIYKDDNSLLSKLEEFTVASFVCSPSDEVILEVAKSRWWSETKTQTAIASHPSKPPSRLKKFQVIAEARSDNRESLQSNVVEELARLARQGFDIDIKFGRY